MANDVYQIDVLGVVDGQPWAIVLHYESTVANTTNPLLAATHLVTAFRGDVEDDLTTLLADNCTITGYKAKRVNNTGGPQYLNPITPVSGGFGATCDVPSISGVVLSYYVAGGKTRSGRIFLPGLPNTAYITGAFQAGFKSSVDAFIAALNSTITSGGDTFQFGIWAAASTTFHLGSPIALSGHLGTQRRRLLPVM